MKIIVSCELYLLPVIFQRTFSFFENLVIAVQKARETRGTTTTTMREKIRGAYQKPVIAVKLSKKIKIQMKKVFKERLVSFGKNRFVFKIFEKSERRDDWMTSY